MGRDTRSVKYTTEDEIEFLRTLAEKRRWEELQSLRDLLPCRRFDAGVDTEAIGAELDRLLEEVRG